MLGFSGPGHVQSIDGNARSWEIISESWDAHASRWFLLAEVHLSCKVCPRTYERRNTISVDQRSTEALVATVQFQI